MKMKTTSSDYKLKDRKLIKDFYIRLSLNFKQGLDNSGMKIQDPLVKDNLYRLLNNVLKEAVDKTYKDLIALGKHKPDDK